MNHLPDNERLLNDVLADESAAGFREALLGETLRQARGKRRRRQARRLGGAVALVTAVAFLIWPKPPPVILSKPASSPAINYQLVRSEPLSAEMLVTTQPLAAAQVIVSVPPLNIVNTTGGGYHVIGDDELLSLSPQPAALVRRNSHQAELVIVKSTDDDRSADN